MGKGSRFFAFAEALNTIMDIVNEPKKEPEKTDEPVETLTAEKLRKMKWMSASQLGAIYHYGKRKVRLDDDPDVYSVLKWFDEEQMAAIFGKDEEEKENG